MDDSKVAVLLEDLRAQFRTFGDGLNGLREEVKQFREETNQRFERLENKLINHIIENREEFLQNKQDYRQIIQAIKELDREVVQLKQVK